MDPNLFYPARYLLELRRANTAAYEPKGKRIWKDYVLKHGSNRTDGSLSTQSSYYTILFSFRRHMYNRLYDANLDRKSMMFLYGCLKIPITDDIRKILELKFQISIVVNKSGLLRNYTTIDPNCNDADDDCEIIDGFEDDSDDSSTYQFPRSHSPCNGTTLATGCFGFNIFSKFIVKPWGIYEKDIKETLAGCRVRDRGLTNVDLTECSQGEGTSILPRFTRSSTYKTLLHEDDECQLIDDKNINSIRQESICKDDRTSISSVIVQLEDRDEVRSYKYVLIFACKKYFFLNLYLRTNVLSWICEYSSLQTAHLLICITQFLCLECSYKHSSLHNKRDYLHAHTYTSCFRGKFMLSICSIGSSQCEMCSFGGNCKEIMLN
uniref:SPK domain-containing protein n=1 Tax=Heterorhabditis bacteriophora TaxID=37862 RepID=A0A1I7WZA2_HETBA